jgi:hypothetical protein
MNQSKSVDYISDIRETGNAWEHLVYLWYNFLIHHKIFLVNYQFVAKLGL